MNSTAGPIKRFLAYSVDSCMAYALYSFLYQWERWPIITEEVMSLLTRYSHFDFTPLYFKVVLFFFLLTQWRFFFTFLFGESLGQWFMGIQGTGSALWKRLGGGVRVQLELLFLPLFFLADLPCLFARRGLKEILSLTSLQAKGQLRFFFSFFFVLPFSICLAIISPALFDETFIIGLPFTENSISGLELNEKSDFSKYTTYQSSAFHFSTLSSLSSKRFELIPSYTVEKQNGSLVITPLVYFYDQQQDQIISLSKFSEEEWYPILCLARQENPLFFARYPELGVALAKDKIIYKRRAYRSEYGNKLILSAPIVEQVKSLIDSSLSLRLKNVSDHVLGQGPFLKGHMALRQRILSVLDLEQIDKIQSSLIGDQHFLVLSGKTLLNDGAKELRQYLWGIDSFNPVLLKLSVAEGGESSLVDLRNEFFSSATWFFDYNEVFRPPLRYQDVDPLGALDLLGAEWLKPEVRKMVEDFLYHHYFDLCKIAVEKNNQKLKDVLLSALNRQTIVSAALWDKNLVGRDYISFIRALKVSLQNGDRRYFDLKP